MLIPVAFQGGEGVSAAEPGEPVGEAVVVGVGRQDRFAHQGGEDAPVLGDPGLDMVEAVIPLGDEEEEPDGQDLAGGQRAFPVGRGREVTVQGGRQVETLEGGPQDGQVGHGLDTQQAGLAGIHPARLRPTAFPENRPEHERTVGYVWILANMENAVYVYRPTRDCDWLHDLLINFKGVLVSDFYSGYDSLACEQQKCLVHLIRDMNHDLLSNPYDEEFK